ncbi:MAG: SDR family oxidoreductase [Silicimonas sp.]|nr:SDR family oxidoreductase [Silicimonas sp.]
MRATYPSLKDSAVVITGGATGIGEDLVRAFHAQGARVAFLDIQDAAGASLAAALPGSHFHRCDVTDIPALQATLARISDTLGPVTTLINNAANDKRQEIEEITQGDWDLSQSINLRPHFFAAQSLAPAIAQAGGGTILNLSSIAWRLGHGEMTPYVTAKSAIMGLTRALADRYGPDNIRVNAIEPGAVMTERQRKLWYPTKADVTAMTNRQSLKRPLEGRDIAAMALFLASDEARAITGQSFIVDAGLS